MLRELDSKIRRRLPFQVEELAGVEVEIVEIIGSTGSHNSTPQALGEPSFVVHTWPLKCEVCHDELTASNSSNDAIGDVLVMGITVYANNTQAAVIS